MTRFGLVDAVDLTQVARADWDREVGRLAANQHGVVSHAQLLAIGISQSTIRERRARGLLIDLHRGVYAVGYWPPGPHGHWTAAVLACGRGAVLSHASAASLSEIRPSSSTRVDITVPGRAGRTRAGIRVHRADHLLPTQVTVVMGIPCTTVARTILDLAGVISFSALEYTIHRAQTKRVFRRDEVVAAIHASPTRPGTAAVRRILGLSLPQEDTLNGRLQRRLIRLCRVGRLPEPLTDHWVALPDGGGYEVDFCWPEHRLIVEADGRRFHDSDRGFENDRYRDRRLRLAGWQVVRFTWRDVTERPDEVIAQLRQLHAMASPASRAATA